MNTKFRLNNDSAGNILLEIPFTGNYPFCLHVRYAALDFPYTDSIYQIYAENRNGPFCRHRKEEQSIVRFYYNT